ncbi:MAG TPA: molybdenum cofactor guanylyltransferase [Thermodesulfobacteriota bacterium]|nr:molybdenum cofactor guanylyltransferase [Thermodesulfobacteriota bacterium]
MRAVAAVLAGGQSRRMGRDKAFLLVGGRPLIERTLATLDRRFDDVLIVANDVVRYAHLGRRVAADLVPGQGALGGLYTAIALATGQAAPARAAAGGGPPVAATHVFVCACDMPFLDERLVALLLERAASGPVDVVVPEDPSAPDSSEGLHPLCAVYSRRAVPAIERSLRTGRLKVIGFYGTLVVRRVTPEELRAAGVPPHALLNANTPEDLARAEALLAAAPPLG